MVRIARIKSKQEVRRRVCRIAQRKKGYKIHAKIDKLIFVVDRETRTLDLSEKVRDSA